MGVYEENIIHDLLHTQGTEYVIDEVQRLHS